eukprot:symbB.v1.2.003701.t1/scaffold206.1/size269131/8
MDKVSPFATFESIKEMHHALQALPPRDETSPQTWHDVGMLTVSSLLHFMYYKWINVPQEEDVSAPIEDESTTSLMLRPHHEFLFRSFVGTFVSSGAGNPRNHVDPGGSTETNGPWVSRFCVRQHRSLCLGRTSSTHRRTLDLRRVARCASAMSTVAVVGGGIAGVAAARVLCRQGYQVRLYERNERLGGRLGNAQMGPHHVGLGTTYVKAKDPIFKAEMAKLEEMGLVNEWNVRTPYFIESPGAFLAKPELKGSDVWYVGRPTMESFVLLEETNLTRCSEVSSLRRDEASWCINGEDEVSALILALPVAQIQSLLVPRDIV